MQIADHKQQNKKEKNFSLLQIIFISDFKPIFTSAEKFSANLQKGRNFNVTFFFINTNIYCRPIYPNGVVVRK